MKREGKSAIFNSKANTNHPMALKPLLFLASIFCSLVCFAQVHRYDVLISEIMFDPNPQVGLPDAEWIELTNMTRSTIDLGGWSLGDRGGAAAILPTYDLKPGSYVVITRTSDQPALSAYAPTLGVAGFPSLGNNGDLLTLSDASGTILHAIDYSPKWYHDDSKDDGGWTLEMINTNYPCLGETNWQASKDAKGGTPGAVNSVNQSLPVEDGPSALGLYLKDDTTLSLTFDRALDDNGISLANFKISGGISAKGIKLISPTFNVMDLFLDAPAAAGKLYTLTISNISDCTGKTSEPYSFPFGHAELPASLDVVVNEILFNPKPGGADYVEVYNRSTKLLEAGNLLLANRNTAGDIANQKTIVATPRFLPPDSYLAITTDKLGVASHHIISDPTSIVETGSLPSWPDEKGTVVLLAASGDILDEVNYSEKWHHELITNPEGVSLERTVPDGPSDQSNFHSASASVKFGTPGYRNSQERSGVNSIDISITPEIFSPDGDGIDDIATINYSLPAGGYVANVNIFNVSGRLVKKLENNSLTGTHGNFTWYGMNDKGDALPRGLYIIVVELFHPSGVREIIKKSLVLARR